MIRRPIGMNPFEFAVLSSLRATQLIRGCIPLVPGTQKTIMTAQMEVAAGKIARVIAPVDH